MDMINIGVTNIDVTNMDVTNMNTVKDNYPDGKCPDCGTLIPDGTVDGAECKNCGHVFYSANTIRYKLLLHWDNFMEYPPREGEITTGSYKTEEILERIFIQEQNDTKNRSGIPSASELDIIELEDGRRFRILDLGFNELCTKDDHRSCEICAKFYIKREDVPKAIHMNVRNTFYNGGKNNLCEKCFRMWGTK